MIEHQQDEKVISGYNPQVIRRLASYAAPYKWYVVLAMVALIVATVGEMLIPVMIQRTVDHEILDYRVRIVPSELSRFPHTEETVTVKGWTYIREEQLDRITRDQRAVMRTDGTLDSTRYLILDRDITRNHGDIAAALAPELVAETDSHTIIPSTAQDLLSTDQRLIARQASLHGVRRNALLFLVIIFGALLGSFGQIYLTAYTGQLVMKRLRLSLFHHTIHQSLGFLGNQAVGRLVTRLQTTSKR